MSSGATFPPISIGNALTAGWNIQRRRNPTIYRGLHRYVTVLVPFGLETMLETTCCDPVFMQ